MIPGAEGGVQRQRHPGPRTRLRWLSHLHGAAREPWLARLLQPRHELFPTKTGATAKKADPTTKNARLVSFTKHADLPKHHPRSLTAPLSPGHMSTTHTRPIHPQHLPPCQMGLYSFEFKFEDKALLAVQITGGSATAVSLATAAPSAGATAAMVPLSLRYSRHSAAVHGMMTRGRSKRAFLVGGPSKAQARRRPKS